MLSISGLPNVCVQIREVNSENMKNETLMTIPELMSYLQVKRNTIYTLRKLGMPTVKIGRSVRFRVASILSWLGSMEEKGCSDVTSVMQQDSSHLL